MKILVILFITVTASAFAESSKNAVKSADRKPSNEELCARGGTLSNVAEVFKESSQNLSPDIKNAKIDIAGRGLAKQIEVFCGVMSGKY